MNPTVPSWKSKLKNRRILLGAIALIALVLLTLIAAPHTKEGSGSTFSRAPDGYGAWYAFMQQQGITISRWQRPSSDLNQRLAQGRMTLLQVRGSAAFWGLDENQRIWVTQGNRLVVLGRSEVVTRSNFSTLQPTPVGDVRINTRRRFRESGEEGGRLLGDRFGAIVWVEPLGKGEIIYAVTPYLAANAYQDDPGNYKFLARIVTEGDRSVWVDEYIHGYKETDIITEETGGQTWANYLATTPLLPALIQGIILLIILIWAGNHRLGLPVAISTPTVDNSKAYIEALAGVLHKAESSEFILEVVGKEEQLQVQKSLGLGILPLAPNDLVEAWTRQTGRPATELERVLRPYWQKRRLSETDLNAWLANLQTLRQHLPS